MEADCAVNPNSFIVAGRFSPLLSGSVAGRYLDALERTVRYYVEESPPDLVAH